MHSIGRKKERRGIYNRRQVMRRWSLARLLINFLRPKLVYDIISKSLKMS